MYILLLLLLWVSSKCAGNFCGVFSLSFHCSGITQEDFLRYSFKNEDDMTDITTIEISNSNFTAIESFTLPRPFIRNAIQILYLKLVNSRIEDVGETAFIHWYAIKYLDLSRNSIHNISFLKHLPSAVFKVDLSHNELTVLDLNLVQFEEISFSHNKINSLKRISGDRHYFKMIDLSYNNLVTFDELDLNAFSTSLDISYNRLEKVLLDSFYRMKYTVNIMGNNISSFGPKNRTNFWCKNILATNLSADTFAYIENSLIMNGLEIGVLDEEFLNLKKFKNQYNSCYKFIVNLSNSSINAISQSFFNDNCVSEINLSYNNITNLEKPIFKNSKVNVINLAYSGIRTISRKTFEGAEGCAEIVLKGNFLRVVDNICAGSSSIEKIDLSYNKIEKISIETLVGYYGLKSLDLSYNSIHSIEPGAFQRLSELRVLNMSNNNITFGNTKMSNLSHIETINLSDNNMEVIETNAFINLSLSYLTIFRNPVKVVKAKAFNNLYRLRVLNLSKIGIEVLERHAFFELSCIETIDLTDNRLSTIMSNTFSNLSVREILLKGNLIHTLKTLAFHRLPKLSNLDLSTQKITEIEYSSFSFLSMEKLDMRYNNISSIGGHIFDNVSVKRLHIHENKVTKLYPIRNNVKIRELSLELRGKLREGAISNIYLEKLFLVNSYIEVIENGSFDGAYNLNELTLKNSSVFSYQPEFLRNLYNLKHIDFTSFMSKQQKIEPYMFSDIGRLKRMSLNHLGLTEIENFTFIGLKQLESLSLVGNRMTKVNFLAFNGLERLLLLNLSANEFISIDLSFIKTLPELKTLDLSNNQIKYFTCHLKNDQSRNHLTTLYLNHNNLSHIKSETFLNLYTLEALYLNNNIITHIDSNALAHLEYLKYLNLENNLIQKVLPDTCNRLKRLESLHLGNNSLEDIPLNIFHNLEILEKLYLDHNHLVPFRSGVFNGPQHLKILDVSHNNLHAIKSLDFTPLRSLSRLVQLNLDSYGLEDDFEYSNIRNYFPYINTININYNHFSCKKLLDMLKFFDRVKIEYTPLNPEYETSNYFGITCYDSYIEKIPSPK